MHSSDPQTLTLPQGPRLSYHSGLNLILDAGPLTELDFDLCADSYPIQCTQYESPFLFRIRAAPGMHAAASLACSLHEGGGKLQRTGDARSTLHSTIG
jgi:hypothetical protein